MRDYVEYEPCQPQGDETHEDAIDRMMAKAAYGPSGRRLGFARMGHVTDGVAPATLESTNDNEKESQ